jgi:hypothetical protein
MPTFQLKANVSASRRAAPARIELTTLRTFAVRLLLAGQRPSNPSAPSLIIDGHRTT